MRKIIIFLCLWCGNLFANSLKMHFVVDLPTYSLFEAAYNVNMDSQPNDPIYADLRCYETFNLKRWNRGCIISLDQVNEAPLANAPAVIEQLKKVKPQRHPMQYAFSGRFKIVSVTQRMSPFQTVMNVILEY